MFGAVLCPPLEILARKIVTGFSPMIVMVGDETGVGKSMLAGRTAELVLYRAFGLIWKPTNNLFFKMSQFKRELFTTQQRILIIEEAEIELGSDDWHSIQNKYFARMKSTQRIKGNLYIVVLPIFMQLAKKHRRAVNYIFDVKRRGFFMAYKVTKKASQVTGDDIGRLWLGGYTYNLPNCKKEYDELDVINKEMIEREEGDKLETEIKMQKSKPDKIYYEYVCPYCKFVWRNQQTPDRNKTCKNPTCAKFIYWDKDHFKVFRVLR